MVDIESTLSTGAWSTLLLCKTEVGIAVVSWLWVSNSLGDAIQEYVSLVEVWAMLKGLDVESFET
jgi:hypothetical protein